MSNQWTEIVKPRKSGVNLDFKEVINYKDLIILFVKRDFVSVYKQTVLGPLWYIIQPLLTTITFTFVFGTIAKIKVTEGVPHALFYMAGIVPWGYFSNSLNRTSRTFTENAGIFGKVYFPRLTVPISVTISNLISFGIQFLLLLGFIAYFHFYDDVYSFGLSINILFLPLLIIIMAIQSLGFGIIISSLTTKYRDLTFLVTFGIQLFMYATPIIYPLGGLNEAPQIIQKLIYFNPMTGIIEGFRNSLLLGEAPDFYLLSYSLIFSIILFLFGVALFNKIERTFMDTV